MRPLEDDDSEYSGGLTGCPSLPPNEAAFVRPARWSAVNYVFENGGTHGILAINDVRVLRDERLDEASLAFLCCSVYTEGGHDGEIERYRDRRLSTIQPATMT